MSALFLSFFLLAVSQNADVATEIRVLTIELDEPSDQRVQVGPDGKRTKEQAWEADIWFKRDGQWKIVHLHYNSREVH